jgi:hypothetical protein
MLLQKIIQELRYIPDDRLVDLYHVIYKSEKPIGPIKKPEQLVHLKLFSSLLIATLKTLDHSSHPTFAPHLKPHCPTVFHRQQSYILEPPP